MASTELDELDSQCTIVRDSMSRPKVGTRWLVPTGTSYVHMACFSCHAHS